MTSMKVPASAGRTGDRLSDRRDIDNSAVPSNDPALDPTHPTRNSDVVQTAGTARFVDAARPFDSARSFDRAADPSFSKYYDEPWYYEQRDSAYVMPNRAVRDDAYRSNTRGQEIITGQVKWSEAGEKQDVRRSEYRRTLEAS